MSRTRRNFSAKFKSDLVLEVLKGEKELNVIATENGIQPNLLRNWKNVLVKRFCNTYGLNFMKFLTGSTPIPLRQGQASG